MGEEEMLRLSRDRQQRSSDIIIPAINDLPRHILSREIFERLQNPQDLLNCMAVCRRWRLLIRSSEFFHHFGFALVVNTPAPNQSLKKPHYATDARIFSDWKGFNLKYLPCFNRKCNRPVCVQASCTDLLLCTSSYRTQEVFYIVNPCLMQWIQLPKTPSMHRNSTFPVGLVTKFQGIQCKYVYKVSLLTRMRCDWIKFKEFDSETGCWSVKLVRRPEWKPKNWKHFTHHQGLAFEGALHWLAKDGSVLVYDPFDDQNECKYISRHKQMRHSHFEDGTVTECLTVSQESLWMVQMDLFPTGGLYGNESHHISIWKLEDYQESKWVLWNRLYFKDMVAGVPWLRDYMHEFIEMHREIKMKKRSIELGYPEKREDSSKRMPEPLACHPTRTNLVYLHLPDTIVSCDMLTKNLEIVSMISIQQKPHYYDTVLPLTLKCPPTPLPLPRSLPREDF